MKLPTEKSKKELDFTKMNTLIYGNPGCGKSTFASNFEAGIFADCENGLKSLEVFKIPISKWEDFMDLKKSLKEEKHNYKTLIIDTTDILFTLCSNFCCSKYNVSHVSDLDYGKGYDIIRNYFLSQLVDLNSMGIGLVFISHAKPREEKTKTEKWTVMDTSMAGQAQKVIHGFVDFIFMMHVDKDKNRLIRTKPTKYINAKDRTGKLPELMEADFGKICKIIRENEKGN